MKSYEVLSFDKFLCSLSQCFPLSDSSPYSQQWTVLGREISSQIYGKVSRKRKLSSFDGSSLANVRLSVITIWRN